MNLTLIGMSNVGKSYWSKKLEKKGFVRFCCDDLIEEQLEPMLKKQGYSGIHDMSKWLGQPFEKQYEQNSQIYLSYEAKIMKDILEFLNINEKLNVVIDTTGSVIHTNNLVLQKIKFKTNVVCLKTSFSKINSMLKLYLEHPKPVIWGPVYQKKGEESNDEALARCYSKLLTYRRLQYNRYADKTINADKLKDSKFNIHDFLKLISEE